MKAKLHALVHLLRYDLRGQDLVEYALMAGFVAVAVGAIFPTTLLPNISQIYSKINCVMGEAAAVGS
jgi:Flp pilus assembly pilin Flp